MHHEAKLKSANKELLALGNLAAIQDVFIDDYVVHAGDQDHGGHEFIARFVTQLRNSIPDLEVTDLVILNENGDTITWQRTLSGTHRFALKGIRASGQRVQWRDMMVSRFAGDKIAEEWTVSGLAGEFFAKL